MRANKTSWAGTRPMPYLNESPLLSLLLRWKTSLQHHMLQPAHLMRVPSESASQWFQTTKWDVAGTSRTHLHPLQISLGAMSAPDQRQTRRKATSEIMGAAATAVCGASARQRCGIVSEVQWQQRAVAHRRVNGAASCPRCSIYGRL